MSGINSAADIQELCMMIFRESEKACTLFLVPLALSRIIYASVSGDDGDTIKETIKGVLVYLVLIYGFEYVLEVLLEIPQAFLPSFSYDALTTEKTSAAASEPVPLGSLPTYLEYFINVVLSGLFWCAVFLHVLFMALMCGMAPIVFILGGVLGIGFGIKVFFGLLVVASSWPILWGAFDQVSHYLRVKGRGDFGDYVVEGLTLLLKAVGPLVLGYSSANSSAGRFAVSTVGTTLGFGKRAGVAAKNQILQKMGLRKHTENTKGPAGFAAKTGGFFPSNSALTSNPKGQYSGGPLWQSALRTHGLKARQEPYSANIGGKSGADSPPERSAFFNYHDTPSGSHQPPKYTNGHGLSGESWGAKTRPLGSNHPLGGSHSLGSSHTYQESTSSPKVDLSQEPHLAMTSRPNGEPVGPRRTFLRANIVATPAFPKRAKPRMNFNQALIEDLLEGAKTMNQKRSKRK